MTVDNVCWLQAIADHPDLTAEDLVGAYDLLGAPTTLTDDQVFWSLYHLETEGFLRINSVSDDGSICTYSAHLPGAIAA